MLSNAAVLVDGARIAAVGPYRELKAAHPRAEETPIRGVLFPGFIDCHTHAVFGAPRIDDHERRALGQSYQAIAAAGGGILESVRDVRARGESALAALARTRLDALRAHGTTTVEIKSGYGLELAAELKQLRVARRLAADGSPAVVATFLGAHEVPPEFRDRRAAYVKLVSEEMLPAVARESLARFCDVFCEPGVFSPVEARTVLDAARRAGLGLKVHADELETSGGAELGVALGAVSVDHLAGVSDAGVRALGGAETVAVLLPATMSFLGRQRQAPARRLIDAGAVVALASDFNPGSSPTVGLPGVMSLAVSQLGMRHAEALTAVTVNAAAALGLAGERGQIAPGMAADLVAADVADWREIAYWVGANVVTAVWTGGSACPRLSGPISLGLNVQA
ncbi:MAG TPA: imidazolonepropionase [Gemmatimonadales bacterium]